MCFHHKLVITMFAMAVGTLPSSPDTANATVDVTTRQNLRGSNGTTAGAIDQNASNEKQDFYNFSEVPNVDGPLDSVGPFAEEPSDDEAEHPLPARVGWNSTNATNARTNASLGSSWFGRTSFCTSHHTGYFCDSTTRIRCCKDYTGWFVRKVE